MKISLLEPIGISNDVLEELSQGLKDRGHEFTFYDTKTTDVEELKKRGIGGGFEDDLRGIYRDRPYRREGMQR